MFVVDALPALLRAEVPLGASFMRPIAGAISRVGGEQAKFGRLVGASKGSVAGWRTGANLPRLQMILRICFVTGLDVAAFLAGDVETTGEPHDPIASWKPKPRGNQTLLEVEANLSRALLDEPPQPLLAVIERSGRTARVVRERFPKLTKQLRDRYRAECEKRSQDLFSGRVERLERQLVELEEAGVGLTRRAVEEEFGMILRDERFRAILVRTRDERLGGQELAASD